MGNTNNRNQFITYLLGAGASANALPIIEELPSRLGNFKNEITNIMNNHKKIITSGNMHSNQTHKILEDLDWLINETKKHASIDTFAKKLSITGKNKELDKLKKLLSFFFIYEQSTKVDNRYDLFIASIIQKSKQISNRIRIISWNYDYQFEKALSEYLDHSKLNIIQEELSISPSPNKINSDKFILQKPETFRIVKLNGTTSFQKGDGEIINIVDNLKLEAKNIDFKKEFENIYNINNNYHSKIRFAWESEELPVFDEVKYIANHTQVIVIIGYSFPFFNREIDKKIFDEFTTKKIYIQDKNPENIKDSLEGVIKVHDGWDRILIHNTKQFLLPYEL